MEGDTDRQKNCMIDVFGLYLLFQVASVHGTQMYTEQKEIHKLPLHSEITG